VKGDMSGTGQWGGGEMGCIGVPRRGTSESGGHNAKLSGGRKRSYREGVPRRGHLSRQLRSMSNCLPEFEKSAT